MKRYQLPAKKINLGTPRATFQNGPEGGTREQLLWRVYAERFDKVCAPLLIRIFH